jgi:hypothetical protein
VVLGLIALAASGTEQLRAQPPKTDPPPKIDAPQPKAAPPKGGVSLNDPKAFRGYTVVAPMNSTKTHLIDMDGRIVKTWESDCTPAMTAFLLENGHLLRPGTLGAKGQLFGAGAGGRIQEFDWDGNVLWDYTFTSKTQQQHHDVHRMPNGNILMISWDKKTADEAIAAGRRADTLKDGHLMADCILEVKPTGKTTGEIVWEWHAWDHLIQDNDKTKANHGNVASHAELIDINFGSGMLAAMMAKKDDLDKLRDLGYVGGPPRPGGGFGAPAADWTHMNSVAYNADLDQIVVSVHEFSEVWIIDHSTTKAEASTHKGGRSGKGGDLLYRWGNPRAYRSGTNTDQRLFSQHSAHWIAKGLPGAGHLLVFNNGNRRPDGSYSSVDEIVLPVDKDGNYTRKPGLAFGPDKAEWSYTAEKKNEFFAMLISGAQRLPNGNTIICSGPDGTVFEVTPDKQIVWKFVNPSRGGTGGPGFVGFGFPVIGQILSPFTQDQLKFTAEQKKEMEALQKEVDEKLEKIMTEEQRKQFKEMKERRPGFGPPPGGGFGPPPGGGFGPPPGGGFGPPGGAAFGPGPGGLFRSYRYGVDYAGLAGKDLKPGVKIEELDQKK